jgi:alpha-tubulin suppressor-like RCC1 family protein
VTGLASVVSLACNGFEYCVAARDDGTVAAWGNDAWGVQGNGPGITDNLTATTVPGLTSIVQVAAGYGTAYAVRADGSVFSWGEDNLNQLGSGDPSHTQTDSPAAVPALSGAYAVAAGSQTAFALRAG